MAGRERSGVKAANASLFQDKWYILVPAEQTSTQALQRVRGGHWLDGSADNGHGCIES